ncbi:response regulator transcription factor [Christensenella tenuis]|jgi:two-component system, response regulator YesN|uniref:Stage 0 sporulation protein A homolog n=1 Tax=Christensenella tenuis TaxID=2763033 RepID=A0ABR7EFA0_9FIRM|nr:response regulator [Christensenella tenuis]MBC5648460.1 response regulator [Christensenella tenuis]
MNSKQFKVVVVEDERLIAKNIKRNIERANEAFTVVAIAHDGEEALRYIEALLPDVVVTDIRMPGIDGIELIGILSEQYPSVRKVIISGHDDFPYVKSAIQNGAANYLLKPVNHEELKETLGKIEREYDMEKGEAFSKYRPDKKDPEDIAGLVKDYIFKNYEKPIDLSTIADELGFSPSYLTKLFTKYVGVSPNRFLKQHRMTIARQLLSDPSYPIKTVAEMVGIPDPFYFSKSFKQIWEMTPSQFRSGKKEE